jgi:hypothetical protein
METANQQFLLAKMPKFRRKTFDRNRHRVPSGNRLYVNEKSGSFEYAAHFGESDAVGVKAGA